MSLPESMFPLPPEPLSDPPNPTQSEPRNGPSPTSDSGAASPSPVPSSPTPSAPSSPPAVFPNEYFPTDPVLPSLVAPVPIPVSSHALFSSRCRFWRREWTLPTLILLLAAFLRISFLGQESLWFDEVHSIFRAQTGGPSEIWRALKDDVHPPLYFWILHYWTQFIQPTEIGARLLSALFGVGAVAALMFWGRALRLPREAWLIGAALFAINPHAIWYSQEARMYALEVFLGTFFLGLTASILTWPSPLPDSLPNSLPDSPSDPPPDPSPQKRLPNSLCALYGLWLLMGVALLWTHFYGLFFIAAADIWALIVVIRLYRVEKSRPQHSRTRFQPWPTSYCLVALIAANLWWVALWQPLAAQMFSRLRTGLGIGWLNTMYRLSWTTPGETLDALICGPMIPAVPTGLKLLAILGFVGVILVGLLPAIRFPRRRRPISGSAMNRAIPSLAALCLLGLPMIVSFWKLIIFGGQRYETVAVAPLCLAAGVGFTSLSRGARRLRILGAAALAVVIAAQTLFLAIYYSGHEKWMWREAVQYIERKAIPGDVITTIPDYSIWVVNYYNHSRVQARTIAQWISAPRPPERVWLLTVSPALTREERALMESGWKPMETRRAFHRWPCTYIRVTLYEYRFLSPDASPGAG